MDDGGAGRIQSSLEVLGIPTINTLVLLWMDTGTWQIGLHGRRSPHAQGGGSDAGRRRPDVEEVQVMGVAPRAPDDSLEPVLLRTSTTYSTRYSTLRPYYYIYSTLYSRSWGEGTQ